MRGRLESSVERFGLEALYPIKDSTGRVTAAGAIVRAITEQKRTEERLRVLAEERETLVREAHHRIKNNITSVTAILRL
jgi:hypothetical protein